ncbi:hypothetical protein E2C01_091914 [Portunus trituberculatus]|uniref:MADF domain-containing protein n=1 Tax=Portunus trituberculatus TaxID=210409 RepID=A0A5B7JWF7_PORTR|nr:hypothetical protein [Portunus trituberculatus]
MDSTKIPWSRGSEASLLELVKEKRFLWHPSDPLYHKNKVRGGAFEEIAAALRAEHPELSTLEPNLVGIVPKKPSRVLASRFPFRSSFTQLI